VKQCGSYLTPQEMQRWYTLSAGMNASGCTATVVVGTLHIGGKRCFTDWLIHSIGLALPERPALERGVATEFAAGMAVAPHPNAIGADGRGSMPSRTYFISEQGAERLSKFPLEWVQR
jgi:Xaa-Pro aminopeptidase